jgi:hypothetical protein
MTSALSQDAVEPARRIFRAFRTMADDMAADRSGDFGWVLYGYAEHQVVLWNARLRHLGVDTSRGLTPIYFFADARPPQTGKQMGELHKTAAQLHQWYALWVSGTRVIYVTTGDFILSSIIASCRGQPFRELRVESCVADMGLRTLAAMLETWERYLVYQAGAFMEELPEEAQRSAARDVFTGWARENLSLRSQAGTRLRHALRLQRVEAEGQDAALSLDELLLRELPGAIAEAWRSTNPEEPIRSTGDGTMSLVRRIGKILEDEGGQGAKEPGLVADEPVEEFSLDAATFEVEAREEAARQEIDMLEEAAELKGQVAAVWKGVRDRLSPEEIAEELGISRNQVYVQKHDAIKRLREARKAAGL